MTRLVLFAGIGLFLSIAVAWTSAVKVDLWADLEQRLGVSGDRAPYWAVTIKRQLGAAYVFRMAISDPAATVPASALPLFPAGDDPRSIWVRELHAAKLAAIPGADTAATFSFAASGWGSPIAVPLWSRAARSPASGQPLDTFVGAVEDGRGWPFICLVSECEATMYFTCAKDRSGTTHWNPIGWLYGEVAWGMPLEFSQGTDQMPRALPFRPAWIGLAANTVFYAGCVWLVLAVPRWLVRRARRKRGRCAACGYILGPSARCPECGAAG